jgi:hypothetical protein
MVGARRHASREARPWLLLSRKRRMRVQAARISQPSRTGRTGRLGSTSLSECMTGHACHQSRCGSLHQPAPACRGDVVGWRTKLLVKDGPQRSRGQITNEQAEYLVGNRACLATAARNGSFDSPGTPGYASPLRCCNAVRDRSGHAAPRPNVWVDATVRSTKFLTFAASAARVNGDNVLMAAESSGRHHLGVHNGVPAIVRTAAVGLTGRRRQRW